MNLLQRLRLVFAAMWNDLFGEDDALSRSGWQPDLPDLPGLQDEAQAQLAQLKTAQTQLGLLLKRSEIERQTVQQQIERLDAEVDAALRAGQDAAARSKLAELERLRTRLHTLDDQRQANVTLNAQLGDEVRRLQDQIDQVRRKAADLAERRRSLQAQEDFSQAQLTLRRSVTALRDELHSQEDRIARQEDRLAARRELERMHDEARIE